MWFYFSQVLVVSIYFLFFVFIEWRIHRFCIIDNFPTFFWMKTVIWVPESDANINKIILCLLSILMPPVIWRCSLKFRLNYLQLCFTLHRILFYSVLYSCHSWCSMTNWYLRDLQQIFCSFLSFAYLYYHQSSPKASQRTSPLIMECIQCKWTCWGAVNVLRPFPSKWAEGFSAQGKGENEHKKRFLHR